MSGLSHLSSLHSAIRPGAEARAAEKCPKQFLLSAVCKGENDKILPVLSEWIGPGKRIETSHKTADRVRLPMGRRSCQRKAVRPWIGFLPRSLLHILVRRYALPA